MTIFEDTRQKIGKHENIRLYMLGQGIEMIRTKLAFGDYTLPTNQSVCVDTKNSIDELYMDLTSSMKRFHKEYTDAERLGIQLYILVENTDCISKIDDILSWENPIYKKFKSGKVKIPPKPNEIIVKQLHTIEENHSTRFVFCNPMHTGKRIIELLGGEECAK